MALFPIFQNDSSSSTLHVLSGTVFGKLIRWELPSMLHTSHTSEPPPILYNVQGHQGVVFRIKFSRNYQFFATTSDDRTVRLWQTTNAAPLLTAWGHTSRTWDVCFVGVNEECLASCSEEGDLRLWNMAGECLNILKGHGKNTWRLTSVPNTHLLLSGGNDSCIKVWETSRLVSLESLHSSILYPIPRSVSSESTDGNRRINGVNIVKISPSGSAVILVLLNGQILKRQLHSATTPLSNAEEWSTITDIGCPVVSADVYFHASTGDTCQVVCSLTDGMISYFNELVPNSHTMTWRAHSCRVINVWFLSSALILSSAAKGVCVVWNISHEDNEPRKVRDVIVDKEIIASCALLLLNTSVLVIGDSHGSICIYQPLVSNSTDFDFNLSGVCTPQQVLHRVHGNEIVTVLQQCASGFISLGHDGNMNIYILHNQTGLYCCINRLSCLPIKSPDYVCIFGEKSELSFYVGGFVGSHYIVHDIRRRYQLLETEAGGWKRPHDVQVAWYQNKLPIAQLVSIAPKDNTNELCIVNGNSKSSLTSSNIADGISTHISSPMNSLESNCSCILPREAVLGGNVYLVGGEEGRIGVYESFHTQLCLVQHLEMSHSVPAKALATCEGLTGMSSCGIVVAGGGRLMLSLWSYDWNNNNTLSSPQCQLLHHQYTGTIWHKATQDHRILSIDATFAAHLNVFIILIGDSRGVATIGIFDMHHKDFVILSQSQESEYPILSNSLVPLHHTNDVNMLCVIGDSSGVCSVALHRLLSSEGVDLKYALHTDAVVKYQAHAMGVNALDTVCSQNITSCTTQYLIHILSGGDDQALTLCVIRIVASPDCMELVLTHIYRQEGSMGSAVKGVALLGGGMHCIAVGYDQRLLAWNLQMMPSSRVLFEYNSSRNGVDVAGACVALSPDVVSTVFVWRAGAVVNIGDVEGLSICSPLNTTVDDQYDVMVIGQGCQLFSILLR